MKCDEISPLLLELVEGIISPGNRLLVDQHVRTCTRCTADLALIGKAFETLQTSAAEEVPSHYFTNLLHRVRRRIDEQPSEKFGFTFPEWAQRLLAPVSAIGVVASFVALYVLLNPANDSMEFQLTQIVSQFPKEDIEAVVDMANYSPVIARTAELHRGVLEMLPNPSLVTRQLDRQLVDDEFNYGDRLSTFLAADITFEDIDDDEVESIIDRLNEPTL